jgi:diacylglycerol kinase (ATP)
LSSDGTYCFIINSASNAFRAASYFRDNVETLLTDFPKAEIIYVQKNDSIHQIAAEKALIHRYVIACGGDGTVNRVANALVGTSAILGVIPLGSGNDFVKNIGLLKDVHHNIRILKENRVQNIDVIQSDWGCFLNTFGIGIDGLINYYAAKSRFKNGSMRYFVSGLKALCTERPFEVTIEFKKLTSGVIKRRVWMVAVANGKTEGGKYTISPGSSITDGKAELILVKDVGWLRLVLEFLKLSMGYSFNPKVTNVYSIEEGLKIIPAKTVKAHADGEQVKDYSEFNFRVLKNELPVVYNAQNE